jgi:hypothetical protein
MWVAIAPGIGAKPAHCHLPTQPTEGPTMCQYHDHNHRPAIDLAGILMLISLGITLYTVFMASID